MAHVQQGLRGFGSPAPHGVVCSCGAVVDLSRWEAHVRTVWTLIEAFPREGVVRVSSVTAVTEELLWQAVQHYHRFFGCPPSEITMPLGLGVTLVQSVANSRYMTAPALGVSQLTSLTQTCLFEGIPVLFHRIEDATITLR